MASSKFGNHNPLKSTQGGLTEEQKMRILNQDAADIFVSAQPVSPETDVQVEVPAEQRAGEYEVPVFHPHGPRKQIEYKTRRVQLMIQPSLHAAVKEAADYEGISFNEYVSEALRAYLKSHE